MRLKMAVFSIFGLVALVGFSLLGGVAAAQTPTPGPGTQGQPYPVRFVGRVDAVGQSSLTLSTRLGIVTANVSQRTWILVRPEGQRRCVEGTLADIRTGQFVQVAGMSTNQQGVVDARVLVQGRCGLHAVDRARDEARAAYHRLAQHVAAGTIKAISGNTITLAAQRGDREITVVTSAGTVVLNAGFKDVSSLKVGDNVQVLGAPQKGTDRPAPSGRTVEAWAIRVVTTNSALVIGRVQSVSGNTLTMRAPGRGQTVTVTLTGNTGYRTLSIVDGKATLVGAAQADVKAGSNLIVEGTTGVNANALSATAVIILPAGRP